MNNFYYYVFEIGDKNVIWAKHIEKEIINKDNYVF